MNPSQPASGDAVDVPRLPAVFEPVFVEEVDSVLAEGIRRARNGAAEGTVVWAARQSAARTRLGHPWQAPPGNLHCAILMRPEYPNERAQQLCMVATLAAGAAIAEVLAPMTGLGFAWPGDILINELLAGQLAMAAGEPGTDPWDWLVIALTVNVAHHPDNPEPERFNSIHASTDGDTERVGPERILEYYARHFLRWVNIWAEEGFGRIERAWSARAHAITGPQRLLDLCPPGATASLEHGGSGALMVRASGQSPRRVSIAEYFGLGDPESWTCR